MMLKKLTNTNPGDMAALIARVGLGLVIFPHGAQKLFGWFGGNGFSGTMDFFTNQACLPWIIAFLVVIGESLGSIALIIGFLGRFMAFSIGLIMVGAIFTSHFQNGFFMNWYGNQAGEGFEYHILAIALALVVVIRGSGKWSVDSQLGARL